MLMEQCDPESMSGVLNSAAWGATPATRCKLTDGRLMTSVGVQLQQITDVITPLLETFSVGILGNPFAFEALQNFTTSAGTQTLLATLRNATDVGLPLLQRVLVRAFSSCTISEQFRPKEKFGRRAGSGWGEQTGKSYVCTAGHCRLPGQHYGHFAD